MIWGITLWILALIGGIYLESTTLTAPHKITLEEQEEINSQNLIEEEEEE